MTTEIARQSSGRPAFSQQEEASSSTIKLYHYRIPGRLDRADESCEHHARNRRKADPLPTTVARTNVAPSGRDACSVAPSPLNGIGLKTMVTITDFWAFQPSSIDPILGLIELHRRAYAVFDAQCEAEEKVRNDSENRPSKKLAPASEADLALAQGCDAGREMELAVIKTVISTPPTTLEGLRVAVDYVAEWRRKEPFDLGEEFNHARTITASLEIISRASTALASPQRAGKLGGRGHD